MSAGASEFGRELVEWSLVEVTDHRRCERRLGLGLKPGTPARIVDGVSRWYRALWVIMALQRLREVALSRRLSRDLKGRAAAPGSFPAMVAAHVGLFVLPPLEVRVTRCRPRAPLLWVLLLLGATGLRWWSIKSLGPRWNIKAVVPVGLRPVASGPYRWIRHPNYLAVILEFAALPMGAGAWRSAAGLSLLNGAVLQDRIRAEEALLAEVPGYEELFATKSRFIPHIF